jgi:alpha-galactosidase
MKRQLPSLLLCLALPLLALLPSLLQAQTSAFTYQGRLLDGGQAANGSYDLRFKLTDALSGGNQAGATLTNAPVQVNGGLFLVSLDFGSVVFDGSLRWLEIGVRTNGSTGAYTVLGPRQAIGAAPYATFASTAAGLVPGTALIANGAGITNLNGAAIQQATINSNQLDQATAAQLAHAGSGSFSGSFSGDLNASSNYNAARLVGTVTAPVASDLSASSNYNANRLVGTIPLTNLPPAVLSNTGTTSNIPISALQPLGSFSLVAVAPTPPMGICTWPSFGGGNQALVQRLSDMLYTNGLVGYGWRVIQLDAGWQLPNRDSQQHLVVNATAYPDWAGTLSYMRSRGIVLGLYTEMTPCGGGVPTLFGYYAQDAAQFAGWGVGYLKVDSCDNAGNGDNRYDALSDFRRAMDAVGFSPYVMTGGWGDPTGSPVRAWLPTVVNSWRLGIDGDAYLMNGPGAAQQNMLRHFHHAVQYGAALTSPGHYPDMDFIPTHQADYDPYINKSVFPYRYPTIESAIGLAAMCPSPIMVDDVSLALMPIYTNLAMIAIDQDPLVLPAQVVSSNATSEVWSRRLSNGDRAVALINKTGSSQPISVSLNALGLPPGPATVYSVWDQAMLPCSGSTLTSSVDSYYTQLLRFSPVQPGLFTGTVGLTSNSVPYTLHITNGLIYGVSSP